VGKNAGLHPLLVMLALIVGAQFGIGGMIIAVPLASVIRVLIREFYWLPIEQRETAMASFPTQHD
jgi:predicted PurR-regulated permease PerM